MNTENKQHQLSINTRLKPAAVSVGKEVRVIHTVILVLKYEVHFTVPCFLY